jgi:hypothetical protein
MNSKRRSVLVALGISAMALSAGRRPVLLDITPDPAMVRPRNFCVMNPFRDRSPERAADTFIRRLREGDVSVLSATVKDPSTREHLMENETKWPITSWRIGRREDLEGRVDLMYWVTRGNSYSRDGHEEEVYLVIDRSADQLRVTEFSAIY